MTALEVLCTSPWVPMEWIKAHGLEPRGAWSVADVQGAVVPEGVCAYAQAMIGLAEVRPESAIVFATSCDQMRRAADTVAAGNSARTFLFNLPATWQTSAARRLYHAEVERSGGFLERLGGRKPTPDGLRSVIRDYGQLRSRLRAILKKDPARRRVEALRSFHMQGTVPSKDAGSGSVADGIPLAVVGGPLVGSQWQLFDVIESVGGCPALIATEPGERDVLPSYPGFSETVPPLTVLTDHYFSNCVDVFQRPNDRLYAWLETRLRERNVRGIVLWAHVGCDLWRAEAASLREAFGLPVLALDSHDGTGIGARDRNRLSALVESLR